jgi:hypothetical protein
MPSLKIIEELPVITMKQLRISGFFAGWYPMNIYSNGLTFWVTGYLDYVDDSRIKLEWEYYGRSMEQYIPLVRVNTNLGEDYFRWFFTDYDRDIWYMKAYFDGERFKPRVDLINAYYEDQIKSKDLREFNKSIIKPMKKLNLAMQLLTGRKIKTHYRGKQTPRMRRSKKLLDDSNRILGLS